MRLSLLAVSSLSIAISFSLAGPNPSIGAPAKNIAPKLNFEFKGVRAGEPVDLSGTKLDGCDVHLEGKTSCNTYELVGGVVSLTIYNFNNGMISSVMIVPDRRYASSLSSSLKEKYGQPCRTKHDQWQSQGGVTPPNTIQSWCFISGELTMYEIGTSLDKSAVIYTDSVNKPAEERPKVDF